MKKFIAILLCLATLFSLLACAAEEAKTETAEVGATEEKDGNKTTVKDPWKKTEEEKVQNNYTVEDKSVKEKLAAIPIANASMTTDELRQICVDFFHLQLSFTWMPSETFDHSSLAVTREPGTVYGGIPYISKGSGNLYRALEYYDEETGILDVSEFLENQKRLCNACSGSAFWAWFRVVNSFRAADGAWTENCTHLNGCLRVGPYTYKDVQNFHGVREEAANKYTAQDATLANDVQTMYQSYALTKPADGLVHPGHVRMVTKAPYVEYNEDGTIDGKKSYLHYSDQVHYVNSEIHDAVQSDGTPYKIQGGVDVKISFADLYSTYYIPFTFAEFLGTDPVEKAYATLGISDASVSIDKLATVNVSSNYVVSDLFITVNAPDGTEVFKMTRRNGAHYVKGYESGKILAAIKPTLLPYAQKGDHTITFTVQSSTGEKLIAYSGILTQ